ncbi:PAS domain-containing protein [Pseudodesulfovibrio cashew]|uniref:histidine kinase n=1 Tax=Pseudodesulfovibrio cashew TaxID=2678688 RepID=A0A6I6JH93_9BACT|nr:ATP-binding protein [Pseudodesulfovibrio cashew]QGY40390.1 PAS domain-containing protein [Pseudodesulfovibrio cashew]
MAPSTTLSDLIGIEHSKLGFFQELQHTIEELQAANEESESQRREIAAILDGITDVMMVLSENLRIISVNHAFREIFDSVEPEGKYCYELFRNSVEPCPECPAFRSLSTNKVCKELAFFRINGRKRQFEMIASPLKGPYGSGNRVLIFKRDVTLEKEYQAKYYQAEKMATVGTLATGVAHEVNNPLMAISGYAEGIQRKLTKLTAECIPAEVKTDFEDYTNTILKECHRCQQIVKSLLNFGHPETSVFGIVNLNDVIKDTLNILGYHLKRSKELSLELDLADELPLIYADEPRLKQVMLNLMTNAADALQGKEGVISLHTRMNGKGAVVLEVADNGCGISPEIKDRLFDPFFTTKPVGKGIGIGLSTCYNIVKDHHGEISVLSEEGVGSRFVVTLPIQQD